MATHRYTQAARRRDEQIREHILAGCTPENTAFRLKVTIGEVEEGNRRMEDEEYALGPHEAARRRMLMMYKVIAEQSMQAWQRSVTAARATRHEAESELDRKLSEHMKSRAVEQLRHLDRALRAVLAEARMRGLDTPKANPNSHASPSPADFAPEQALEPTLPELAPAPRAQATFPPRAEKVPPIRKTVIEDVCSDMFRNGT